MKLKSISHIILLYIFLFLLSANTRALEPFTKFIDNPLNFTEISGYQNIFQSHIFLQNNTYLGLFSNQTNNNKFNITLGTSLDGKNWFTNQEVIISDVNLYAPRLLKLTDSSFKLYYTKEQNSLYIYSKECSANFVCDNEVLELSPNINSWDKDAVGGGFPYKIANNLYLFYEGLNNTGWHLGMATYSQGQWLKCSVPIIETDNPGGGYIYFSNGTYYLIFHSSRGIEAMETTQALGCDTQWTNRRTILSRDQWYDQNHMIAPSIIEKDGKIYLYYSGLGNDGKWRLNLAETFGISPTPTPNPSPIPTTVPSITPSPTQIINPTPVLSKVPIVIIPGMFASWNKDALIHNQETSIFDWKLASFSHEYDGIINSLKNIGYIENEDFYIFPYDWRKSIVASANDLDTFLQSKVFSSHPNTRINLVGHSLGGLVGRIYTQEHSSNINKIITVGSPHSGVVQVYPPLAGGEIEKDNSLLWFTQKMILTLNKGSFKTDKDILRNNYPVLFDMLPTFDFLKKSNNLISNTTMSIRNTTLPSYNASLSNIDQLLISIYGEKNTNTTPQTYKVTNPNNLDTLLGNYSDGRPIATLFGNGDYTVLSSSAKQGSHYTKLPLDHSELITEKEAIKTILSALQITYKDNQIKEGKKTKLMPSLVLLIKSKAHLQINTPNNKAINEEDGIVFVEGAKNGKYSIKVVSDQTDDYTIYAGQIGKKDKWETIKGKIKPQNPASKVDTYTLDVDLDK